MAQTRSLAKMAVVLLSLVVSLAVGNKLLSWFCV